MLLDIVPQVSHSIVSELLLKEISIKCWNSFPWGCHFVMNTSSWCHYDVIRDETWVWISLITCNFAPFYPIEMWFSPEIIELYAENHYRIFNISFLNFLSDAKFGHHIWRHNSSPQTKLRDARRMLSSAARVYVFTRLFVCISRIFGRFPCPFCFSKLFWI